MTNRIMFWHSLQIYSVSSCAQYADLIVQTQTLQLALAPLFLLPCPGVLSSLEEAVVV